MNLSLAFDVVKFELQRSLTIGRIGIWFILTLFPVALMTVMRMNVIDSDPEPWGLVLYFLVPEVICLLGLLLWATPVLSTEIEGQTWIYLAMRSSGRGMVIIGKYLTAVLWSLSATLVSTAICVVVMGPVGGVRLWLVMSTLCVLSAFAHASLYVLIGTLFFRRTMATAVLYTLAIEYGLSLVPALANKLTINYRLRGLLADWMNWEDARSAAENVFGSEPAFVHLGILAAMSVLLLGIALVRIQRSEFPTQQEG